MYIQYANATYMDSSELLPYIEQINMIRTLLTSLQSTVALLERKVPTANAMASINGNRAEHTVTTDMRARNALSAYHNKSIVAFTLVPGKKKTDVKALCDDNSAFMYQVKNSDSPGGSYHINRKPLEEFTADNDLKRTLNTFLLRQAGTYNPITKDVSHQIIRLSLLGIEPDMQPTHILHTVTDGDTVKKLFVCQIDTLIAHLCDNAYETALFKTGFRNGKESRSIWLTPGLTLQRRGGDNTDSRPDDIQTKLGLTKKLLNAIFTELTLV